MECCTWICNQLPQLNTRESTSEVLPVQAASKVSDPANIDCAGSPCTGHAVELAGAWPCSITLGDIIVEALWRGKVDALVRNLPQLLALLLFGGAASHLHN